MSSFDPMTVWSGYQPGPIRHESHYGDRVVRCFAERPASLNAMFADALALGPDRDALVFEGRCWTYRALAQQVDRLAAGLAARGIGSGDRVSLFLSNRSEFIVALFAIQRIGAVAVPVGIREQRPGLAWMLNQCTASAVFFDASLLDRIPDAGEVASLRLRVSVGGACAGAVTDTELIALGATLAVPAMPVTHEEDVAAILYTSGTTGRPKGAMLTHLSIAHSVRHFACCMKLGPDERALLAVPASHVTGLIALIATMVHVGGALVVVPEFKAAQVLPLMAAQRITFTVLVPAMYNLCLMQPDFADHDLSPWRIAGFGGAPMPTSTIDKLARHLPGLVLVNAYGATETTSPATVMPLGQNTAHGDSVGLPAPCASMIVVDDDGRELPPGQTGEIWIGGPMVVKGYWDDAAATRREFTGGYWHSGDVGSIGTDGYVRLFDRKKDMLNRGGYKVYSVEVENVLLAFPGIVEAAVIGKPCPVLGERVHAFIHAPSGAPDLAALREHCQRMLADYKVPESFVFKAEPLTRNANGKLMKRLMREELLAD